MDKAERILTVVTPGTAEKSSQYLSGWRYSGLVLSCSENRTIHGLNTNYFFSRARSITKNIKNYLQEMVKGCLNNSDTEIPNLKTKNYKKKYMEKKR